MLKTLIFSVALLMFISCKKNEDTPAIPSCMQTQIDLSLSTPKCTYYLRIDAYKYQGNTVYLFYTGCCDRYNEVKDEQCKDLFAPSGGIGGEGDGTHPNFYNEATFVSTIWVDPRP